VNNGFCIDPDGAVVQAVPDCLVGPSQSGIHFPFTDAPGEPYDERAAQRCYNILTQQPHSGGEYVNRLHATAVQQLWLAKHHLVDDHKLSTELIFRGQYLAIVQYANENRIPLQPVRLPVEYTVDEFYTP
jgi:hypothetical protein